MLPADSQANSRIVGLSKPEWLLLGLTLLILMCGVVGLSAIQIQEIGLSFFWDPKAILITALLCIALASIKPRSANKAETFGERLLWSAKYVTFFLTFSMVGSALFEENAKAIGPMLALAVLCYLYCSAAWICFSVIKLRRTNALQSTPVTTSDLKILPLFTASWFLVVSFCTWMVFYVLANEAGDNAEFARGFMSVKDVSMQEIGKEALAHGLITTTVCFAVLFGTVLATKVTAGSLKISFGSQDLFSLALLVFSYFAVIDIRNTLTSMYDPVSAVSNITSMVFLLTSLGLIYAVYMHLSNGIQKVNIRQMGKQIPIPLGALSLLFFIFRDLSAQALTFGIFALLLMLLFVFYLNDLENQILSRTEELREERAKSDSLLANMLPGYVIDDLKQRGVSDPKTFPEISVMFTDFVGFTKITQGMTPEALIDDLNKLFSGYDEIVEAHESERIKTIGDAYMCASGLSASSSDSTANLVAVAHAMLKFTTEFNRANGRDWQLRIGIAHGDCVGGVVGEKKYLFDLFGDVVNTAARMESHSEPGRINVDEATFFKASNKGSIEGEKRPLEFVKGKGELQMYFLN